MGRLKREADDPIHSGRVPRLAVTLGDPRGIGPEVVAKALGEGSIRGEAEFLLIGPPSIAEAMVHLGAVHPVSTWEPGDGVAAAGRAAGEAVAAAVDLIRDGLADGLVTAPIDKAALHAGGWSYPGHTEMLHHLAGADEVAMMMVAERTRIGGSLRVVLATTHIPLRDVAQALSAELLVSQTTLTHRALLGWWGITAPRIALCGVNPHAGDGGRFGDEEARIIEPALTALRAIDIAVDGPVPADTVFSRALAGEWDAVIAPYHDVGMAAFKTASFGHGVNVTLGLPFPRTSPDHGTALGIAGRDQANPSSMTAAIRLAIRLAAL